VFERAACQCAKRWSADIHVLGWGGDGITDGLGVRALTEEARTAPQLCAWQWHFDLELGGAQKRRTGL
jgi:hypothetical protein